MDDDPHMLSLADALTCAFGASIMLFLIFVVLVRFEPPSPVPTSGAQAANSITRSLANDQPGLSSLVIIASSRISAKNCDGSALVSLFIEGVVESNTRIWTSEQQIWKGPKQDGVLCRKVFEVPDGVTADSQPAILSKIGKGQVITFRVHIGAIAWPSWTTFHSEKMAAAVTGDGQKILIITGDSEKPISTRKDF